MVDARRCYVEGRVQGVWFRDSTRKKAHELGLTGHALNLADGRVEVLVCGAEKRVDALAEWLWNGSALSKVTAVHCEAVELADAPDEFTIG